MLGLFPIRLDDTVMQTQTAWASDIRRMRFIGLYQWLEINSHPYRVRFVQRGHWLIRLEINSHPYHVRFQSVKDHVFGLREVAAMS